MKVAVDPKLKVFLQLFWWNRRGGVARLSAGFAVGDWIEIAIIARDLKESGVAYGFPDLALAAGHLEEAALNEQWSEVESRIMDLREFLVRLELDRR